MNMVTSSSLAAPVVEGCLTGLNGLVMAYGQTASGKSHTMGVLQGVDVAAHDAASLAAQDRSCLQETRSSPRGRSGEEGLRGSNGRGPSLQGHGKANGVRHHSHNQAEPGIIPRALSRVFEHMEDLMVPLGGGSPDDVSPTVKVSLLQIYNETVQVRNIQVSLFSAAVGRGG